MSNKQERSSGHGHVVPTKDGSVARCGGPGLCTECSLEELYERKRRNLEQEVLDLVTSCTGWSLKKARLWMKTANPLLGGITPARMIAIGRGKNLLKWIKATISGERPWLAGEEIRQLKEIAEAATPGPYEARCKELSNSALPEIWTEYGWLRELPAQHRVPTIEFQATFNPETVLKLLDEIECRRGFLNGEYKST